MIATIAIRRPVHRIEILSSRDSLSHRSPPQITRPRSLTLPLIPIERGVLSDRQYAVPRFCLSSYDPSRVYEFGICSAVFF
jgi:hypothetical protein